MTLQELKDNLDIHLNTIGETVKDFPWNDRDHYSMWLRQTYSFVCHSTRLLTLTASHTKNEDMHNRFLDHAVEEQRHERLLEKDFKQLDVDQTQLPELLPTMGIYQTQYYWVQHVHPLSLFGYVLLLEGLAVAHGQSVYDAAKQAFGDSACNFIRVHVAADEDHLPKAFKALESCSAEEIEIISKALDMSAGFYNESIRAILSGEWRENLQSAA